jgi:hypothetical protein
MSLDVYMSAAVAKLGGKWLGGDDEPSWVVESNGFVAEGVPVVVDIAGEVEVAFAFVLGHLEFGRLANRIMGEPLTELVPLKAWETMRVVEGRDVAAELERQMRETLEVMRNANIEEMIDRFAKERPDSPSSAQIAHLAALAWKAEFSVLDDYLTLFRAGKRMNFVHIEIAAERM